MPTKKGRKSPPEPLDDKISATFQTSVITPSSIEVPPPPPVEKEQSTNGSEEDNEDEVGDTVDIPLN
jgi:hypothetical protein